VGYSEPMQDRIDVFIKSSNLGDNRTLAIPVAHTIYYEMGRERRASMGIEDSQDLIKDFEQAFAALWTIRRK